jgi:hypothetical protein
MLSHGLARTWGHGAVTPPLSCGNMVDISGNALIFSYILKTNYGLLAFANANNNTEGRIYNSTNGSNWSLVQSWTHPSGYRFQHVYHSCTVASENSNTSVVLFALINTAAWPGTVKIYKTNSDGSLAIESKATIGLGDYYGAVIYDISILYFKDKFIVMTGGGQNRAVTLYYSLNDGDNWTGYTFNAWGWPSVLQIVGEYLVITGPGVGGSTDYYMDSPTGLNGSWSSVKSINVSGLSGADMSYVKQPMFYIPDTSLYIKINERNYQTHLFTATSLNGTWTYTSTVYTALTNSPGRNMRFDGKYLYFIGLANPVTRTQNGSDWQNIACLPGITDWVNRDVPRLNGKTYFLSWNTDNLYNIFGV